MTIRHSCMDDLTELLTLFAEARGTIAQLGIDQWQDGYPSETVITQDIVGKRSYVVEQEGAVQGAFVLVNTEPDYDRIYEGSWKGKHYIAIHRVAVKVSQRGTGITDAIVAYAAEYAHALECDSLRIDTHRGNIPMRRMLEKRGFQYRGVIYLSDGAHRVAYEKSLW